MLLVLFLLVVLFVYIIKNVIKNLRLINHFKSEPDYYRSQIGSSKLVGIFWFTWKLFKLGIPAVKGCKIMARIGRTAPFCESGILSGWLGNIFIGIPYVLVTRTEVLKSVLASKKHVSKAHPYFALSELLGNGLLVSDRFQWYKHRKLLNPAFNQQLIQNFVPVINSQSEQLVQNISKVSNGGKIVTQVTELLSERIMAILLETLMGSKESDINPEFRHNLELLDLMQFNRFGKPWKLLKWYYKLTPEGQKFYETSKFCKNESRRLILKRISEISNSSSSDCDLNSNYDIKDNHLNVNLDNRRRLLDILFEDHLKDNKLMSLDMMTDEVQNFLFAGWDTTTWATTYVLLMLGNYQDVQDKVFQEIVFHQEHRQDNIEQDHNHDYITLESVKKLTYLDCVIRETLRYLPIVTLIGRHLYEDVFFTINGRTRKIPAGTEVVIDPDIIHRSDKYWKNPNKFDPDRFLPANSVNRDPFSFVTFSHGPRNCIGKIYGMIKMKIIIVHLLKKFKITSLEPLDQVKFNFSGIVRRTQSPLKFQFETRITKSEEFELRE